MSENMAFLEHIREALGEDRAQRARDGAGGWIGLLVEVERAVAENTALREALAWLLEWAEDPSDHYALGVHGPDRGECDRCGTDWPCAVERARALLGGAT